MQQQTYIMQLQVLSAKIKHDFTCYNMKYYAKILKDIYCMKKVIYSIQFSIFFVPLKELNCTMLTCY